MNETILNDGSSDLSGQGDTPTVLNLGQGTSRITNSVVDAFATPGGPDQDVDIVSFLVPEGSVLTSLELAEFTSNDDVGFVGIVTGDTFPANELRGDFDVSLLLGQTLFGAADLDENLLVDLGNGAGATGFDGAAGLGAGSYTILIQQIGATPIEYSLDFTLETTAIQGTEGDDPQLAGTDGPDRIEGLEGNDTIDGGEDRDTAVFSGDQSAYTLQVSSGNTVIADRRLDGDGTDELISIEALDFATELPIFDGAPMDLDAFDDASSLSAEQFALITELYIAYFNRAPDAIGLNFWASAFARNEVDLDGMAELFFDQEETRTEYASFLNEDGAQITDVTGFVTEIFTNVLGRTPDPGGLSFWVDVLGRGDLTPGSAINGIIAGAKVDAPEGATPSEIADRALDQQYLSNATDIGVHFAVINGMSDTNNADAVLDLLTRSAESVSTAVAQSNQFFAEAQSASDGEFLFQLVGVIDDPFAV